MSSPASLGQFEQSVLGAILHSEHDPYGVSIHEAVEELAARRVALGAVYATLERLEE